MKLTLLGYILIPATVLASLWGTEGLFLLMVFVAPFQASAVMNFPSVTFGLQPGFFVGLVWMVFVAAEILGKGRVRLPRPARLPALMLTLFAVWVIFGAGVLPAVFAGKVLVLPPEGGGYVFLNPSRLNLSQSLYIVYLVLLFLAIITWCNNEKRLMIGWRAFIASGAFVGLYGLYQFVGHYLGWALPVTLLHNNCGFSQGFGQVLGVTQRVSSVLSEPSMCALFLAGFAGAVLVHSRYAGGISLASAAALWLAGQCLLLTFSTTAYVTLAVWGLVGFITWGTNGLRAISSSKLTIRPSAIALFLTVMLLVSAVGIALEGFLGEDEVALAIRHVTLDKMTSYSFQERSEWNVRSWDVFVETWGLGAGWGSNRASSMLLNLLSNLGFIGTSTFAAFVAMIGTTVWRNTASVTSYGKASRGLLVGWLMMITAGFVAVPDITTLMFFWIVPALALASVSSGTAVGSTRV